jgi:hypothetical protein
MLPNPWTENNDIGPGKIIRPMGTKAQFNALGLKFLDLGFSQSLRAYLQKAHNSPCPGSQGRCGLPGPTCSDHSHPSALYCIRTIRNQPRISLAHAFSSPHCCHFLQSQHPNIPAFHFSSQLQCTQGQHGQQNGQDPKPYYDLGFRDSREFKVVVNGGHAKEPFPPGKLEIPDLNDH